MSLDPVTRADIAAAHARIQGYVRRTPLLEGPPPFDGAPPISFKLESLQHSGSFKARGAFYNLLTKPVPAVGCATASGGNHGAAVAFAAARLGVPAKIFVPTISSPEKIAKIRAYGALIHIEGKDYHGAQMLCDAYAEQTGALKIHPYDSTATIAGQGTVALEWEQDLARLGLAPVDTVLVAVGGGGLIAGVAAWFDNRVKVVGVEPGGAATMASAFSSGRPITVEIATIAADSLGARRVGDLPFAIARTRVERIALVSDEAILDAQRKLWREFNFVAEPGGATAYAALLSEAYAPAPTERVGVLICGGNANLAALARHD